MFCNLGVRLQENNEQQGNRVLEQKLIIQFP